MPICSASLWGDAALLPLVGFILMRRNETAGADMKQRLWLSLALIAVLFCFWLLLTKPMCREGFVATLGARSGWSCVAGVI
jgi:hypothetical protein